MSLKYTKNEQVAVSRAEGFRTSTVNTALRRLVENDETFKQTGVSPGIWERRWLNNTSDKSLYYMKGDAVWVNTEQEDQFVAAHIADIDAYVQFDSEARYELAALSAAGDSAGVYRLYRDMALGEGRYRGRGIYYLGNLLDQVQIRISKIDYNDKEPRAAGDEWEDFFDRSRDETYYRNQILSVAEAQLSAEYARHVDEYHLTGVSDQAEFLAGYLRSDMSNVAALQKFTNHAWYQKSMPGMDYALQFRTRRPASGQIQWYRLWNSGLLEHGGIVDVSRSDCGKNNQAARVYTVDLSWPGADGPAPVYDHPADALGGFYSRDGMFHTWGGDDVQYRPGADSLGPEKRYVVEVQPVRRLGEWDGGDPYPAETDLAYGGVVRYPVREVMDIRGGSFSFPYARGMQAYSYRTRGFATVNGTRAFR